MTKPPEVTDNTNHPGQEAPAAGHLDGATNEVNDERKTGYRALKLDANVPRDFPAMEKPAELTEQEAVKKYHLEKISPEGKKLVDEAFKKISNPEERELFLKNMETFEHRPGLINPDAERAKTYKQISRLMEAEHSKVGGDDPKLQERYRLVIAENLIQQSAVPKHTDQGHFLSCNVTALSEREFTRNPSMMAEIAATTAINGEWADPTDPSHPIKIDAESLKPSGDWLPRNGGGFQAFTPEQSTLKIPTPDGMRSYAEQLLNNAMINDVLAHKDPPERYCLKPDKEHATHYEVEERWNEKTKSWEEKQHFDGLNTMDLALLGKRIGDKSDFMIANNLLCPPKLDSQGKPLDDGVLRIDGEESLRNLLHKLKAEHRLPVVIAVNAGDPLFQNSQQSAGGHVVSIRDFDDKVDPPRVRVSNQWGSNTDIVCNVEDLSHACSPINAENLLNIYVPPLAPLAWDTTQWKLKTFGKVEKDNSEI